MKIEYITINAGQRFDAVMPEIPTNSIINKTVTGCGATYAEINAPRHSVIIEPNVPVIEGKLKKAPADTRRVRGRNDRGHHRLSEHELQRRLSENHDHARKFPQSPLGDGTDAYGYAR